MRNRKIKIEGWKPYNVVYLTITPRSIVAEGPQMGGWRSVWIRQNLIGFHGGKENSSFDQIMKFFRRGWKAKVTEIQ